MLKCWNHSTTTRNNAVTYYKTLEDVPWQLGLRELKKWQTFSESLKIAKIIKLRLFSDRLFVSSHGGGRCTGGWWGGGGQQWGGGNNLSQFWGRKVKSQTKNRSNEKSHKKTDRTNIIATNFVWEQLIITLKVLNKSLSVHKKKEKLKNFFIFIH